MTFGFEFSIMLITIWLFRLVNIKYESVGFAEYSINKRTVGFLMPLLMMGLGVSLPKFLASSGKKEQLSIHYSALLLVTLFCLLFSIIIFLGSEYFSQLIFGDYDHEKMLLVVLFYVLSLMYHATVYNYFRGKFNYKVSSILQLINLGLLPLITYFIADTVEVYFFFLALAVLACVLITNLAFIPFFSWGTIKFKPTLHKLVLYGIQRMPGDVLLGFLFAMPVYMVSNSHSLELAGIVAFCLSLFNIIIALMSPLNIILLPEASKIIANKENSKLRSIGVKLLYLAIVVGCVALVIILFFGQFILSVFDVENVKRSGELLVIVFTGVVGYSVFSIIRSIVDAYYQRALMTLIIGGAFFIYVLILLVMNYMGINSVENILIGLSFSVNILGVFTFYALQNIFKRLA